MCVLKSKANDDHWGEGREGEREQEKGGGGAVMQRKRVLKHGKYHCSSYDGKKGAVSALLMQISRPTSRQAFVLYRVLP